MIPLLKRAASLYSSGVLDNNTFGLLVLGGLLKAGLAEIFPVFMVWGFLGAAFIVVMVLGDRRGVLQFCLHWAILARFGPITWTAIEHDPIQGAVWLATTVCATVGASVLVATLVAPKRRVGSLQGTVIQRSPRELE